MQVNERKPPETAVEAIKRWFWWYCALGLIGFGVLFVLLWGLSGGAL